LTRHGGAPPGPAVVLDTNVFVAAAFQPTSESAQVLEDVRSGRLRLVWNEDTCDETRHILRKIPPISWEDVEPLFREGDRRDSGLETASFETIADPDDRKFAALAAASGATLLSLDDHLLAHRGDPRFVVTTPREFLRRHEPAQP
jgi:uncharacterized protein